MALEDIRGDVFDWISANNTRLAPSVVTGAINLVQREFLRANDHRFGEFSDTFQTVIGQWKYTLPVGFERPLVFWYLSNGQRKSVKQLHSLDAFIDEFPDPTVMDAPCRFLIYGTEIWLGKTPASVATISRTYYRTLPDLADGAPNNTNAFTDSAPDFLRWGALVHICKYLIEDPRLPVFQENFERVRLELLSSDARQRWSADSLVSQEAG